MSHAFVDESGDVVSLKGTKYFVVAVVITSSKKKCEQLISGLVGGYPEYFHNKKFNKEVKMSNLNPKEKAYFIDGLKHLDFEARCGCLNTWDNKNKLNQLGPHRKKTHMVQSTMSLSFITNPAIQKFEIDRGTLTEEGMLDLKDQFKKSYRNVPKIITRSSQKVAGIRIADLVAGAVRENLGGEGFNYASIERKIKKTEF